MLADTHDRSDAVLQRGERLRGHQRVGLAVVLAALGVADHDVGAVQLGQHRRGDVTGVRAGGVLGDVLRAVLDTELVALDQGLHRADVGERDQDGDVDRVVVLVVQREGELLDVLHGLEVVEVHLPVAGHQRLALGHLQFPSSSRTARPGRVLPSRYSRLAPPPVEIWPKAPSSNPRVRTAAALSPPPTTVNASESIRPCATARVPPASLAANSLPDSGPMSRPIRSAGISEAGTTAWSASAANAVAATMSTGS